ncbi:MAG TPA: Maf family nucleotide pyrophosphatase [Bacteroidales bacterium]
MDPLFSGYNFILASKSPRRQYLLNELGLHYTILAHEIDEVYPDSLKRGEIALYLSSLKADAFSKDELGDDSILITADTIVWMDDRCIGKPENEDDAIRMLASLSGRMHSVYTGICLQSAGKRRLFEVRTDVYFRLLLPEEIEHYVKEFKPLDKAGAYGIQEWIGIIGVSHIDGCYFNVMGLPVQRLYEEIGLFIGDLKKG